MQMRERRAGRKRGIQAVLFDVGGPLNTEAAQERLIDQAIKAALAEVGRPVDDEEYASVWQWAVDSFSPNAYQAVIWRLTGQDPRLAQHIYRLVVDRASQLTAFELRAGIPELLLRLRMRGLRLGLAANQPDQTFATLTAAGIGPFFDDRTVTSTAGYRKPDVRLFLTACEALGVPPAATVMVGDRIDTDIAPARAVGMRTVLFRTGRHASQQPRTWEELPDIEVSDVRGLEVGITRLVEGT